MILRHSALLHPLLTTGATGRVLAVYHHSLYLELRSGRREGVVAVVDAPLGNGPLNLVARHLADPPVAVGDPAGLLDGWLRIGPLQLRCSESAPWDPVVRVRPPELRPEAVEGCWDLVVRDAPPHSLAALLPALDEDGRVWLAPWQERAQESVRRLVRGIRTGSVREIGEGVMGLVGLGPGLTPSGDDFLCGVLLGLSLDGDTTSIRAILRAARATHRISRAYLRAAGQGGASEAWHRLLRALCGTRGWEEATRTVLRTGQTSGADALAGFLTWWATRARRPRTGRRPLLLP